MFSAKFTIRLIIFCLFIMTCVFGGFALYNQDFSSIFWHDNHTFSLHEERLQQTGLVISSPEASVGYTLITAMKSKETYLIDNDGKVANQWLTDEPGLTAYLLPNGNLLRVVISDETQDSPFHSGGESGRIQEFTWEGDLLWDFKYASENYLLHHGVEPLPNGNFLMIAWEQISAKEAIAAGRNHDEHGDGEVWSDRIIEVKPTGKSSGEIIWQWRAWEHLVQDQDPTKPNYGDVAKQAHRIDVNFSNHAAKTTSAEVETLQSLGYMGNISASQTKNIKPDWTHINAVSYNKKLDKIAMSVREFNEVWIIDHSTATEQAAGRSGELLYRWGNPAAYKQGTANEQQLFSQHDVQWLDDSASLLVFNNGRNRPGEDYSTIIQIELPFDSHGSYKKEEGKAFGPATPSWEYFSANKTDFFSSFLSGAQRLPNGNTLICHGMDGSIFEVTKNGVIVWKYILPLQGADLITPGMHGYRMGVFTARRYAPDYPAFEGKNLTLGVLLDIDNKNRPND